MNKYANTLIDKGVVEHIFSRLKWGEGNMEEGYTLLYIRGREGGFIGIDSGGEKAGLWNVESYALVDGKRSFERWKAGLW